MVIMTRLYIINYFFLQIFFIRVARVTDKDSPGWTGYAILLGIVPFTGWSSEYKYLFGRIRMLKLYK